MVTVFECLGLEDFLIAEARAQEIYEYHNPPTEDGDCRHCGEPLGLDDEENGAYRQECGYCGRQIWK